MKKSELKQLIKEVLINEFKQYSGDPIWITAKYPGKDMYGTPFKKGEEILYYPRQPKGKNIIAGKKAEQEYQSFVAAAEDEDMYMSLYDR